jgi:Family of unknown function (DUF5908)
MPLEIRELQIRVTVNQPKPEGAEANPVTGQTPEAGGTDALVAQCIEEVLRILQDKEER